MEEQTDFEMKNNMKVVERINRIVVKGRKVVDFPNFKNKKKKKKGVVKKNNDEIIYYFSGENL